MIDRFNKDVANTRFPEFFAPWIQDLGLQVEAVGADGVTMRMPYSSDLCRVGSIVCGQALMSLADTCMVYVFIAAMGEYREMATASQNTNFFRPVIGSDVLAHGHTLKVGKTLLIGEVILFADNQPDQAVAQATSTYALIG